MSRVAPSENYRHITSLVVFAHPESQAAVMTVLQRISEADVTPGDIPGRFVVCLESETLAEATATIESIRESRGVQGACLVFHQQERADCLDEAVPVTHASVSEVTP